MVVGGQMPRISCQFALRLRPTATICCQSYMISRDYMKEIGNTSTSPRLSLPVAIALLALGAAALWFGVAKIRTIPSAKPTVTETPAVAGKPGMHPHTTQR